MKELTIRELISLDVDTDICNDVTEDMAPAFCGEMNITENGIKEFKEVLDIVGVYDNDERLFTVLIDKFVDWEKKWNMICRFFTCAAGYCDCDEWDNWFADGFDNKK